MAEWSVLREVVSSQIISSVGYDQSSHVLEVEFRNGWLYRYEAVPYLVYKSLMTAESHGRYLKRFIVDRYPTTRLS